MVLESGAGVLTFVSMALSLRTAAASLHLVVPPVSWFPSLDLNTAAGAPRFWHWYVVPEEGASTVVGCAAVFWCGKRLAGYARDDGAGSAELRCER
jgi:hypothetical protein